MPGLLRSRFQAAARIAAGHLGIRVDPFAAFNFVVEVDGFLMGGFNRAEGLGGSITFEPFVEGGVNESPHQLIGETHWQPLILSRGLTDNDTMWNWFEATSRGVLRPRSGMVLLLDERQIPIMFWDFKDALPSRWTGPTFDAEDGSQLAMEQLELVHRGLSKPAWQRVWTAARVAERSVQFARLGLEAAEDALERRDAIAASASAAAQRAIAGVGGAATGEP